MFYSTIIHCSKLSLGAYWLISFLPPLWVVALMSIHWALVNCVMCGSLQRVCIDSDDLIAAWGKLLKLLELWEWLIMPLPLPHPYEILAWAGEKTHSWHAGQGKSLLWGMCTTIPGLLPLDALIPLVKTENVSPHCQMPKSHPLLSLNPYSLLRTADTEIALYLFRNASYMFEKQSPEAELNFILLWGFKKFESELLYVM